MTRITITGDLARAVGHVAALHGDDAITIEWAEGSPENEWSVMTSGSTRQNYKIDDESGRVLSVGWYQ
jgi:hypothetical protein